MNSFTKRLIPVLIVGILAGIGLFMGSHHLAAADAGPTVTIGGPLPVPVTGLSTVSGTVSLSGQPIGVTVQNSPVVQLASGASVAIANPVANPVRIRNVNDGIQPVQAHDSCGIPVGSSFCTLTQIYVVPAGKRLVIENVSVSGSLPPTQSINAVIATTVGGIPAAHFLTLSPPAPSTQFGGASLTSLGQQVRLYADAGTTVGFNLARSDLSTGTAFISATFSGYLVDIPFVP